LEITVTGVAGKSLQKSKKGIFSQKVSCSNNFSSGRKKRGRHGEKNRNKEKGIQTIIHEKSPSECLKGETEGRK